MDETELLTIEETRKTPKYKKALTKMVGSPLANYMASDIGRSKLEEIDKKRLSNLKTHEAAQANPLPNNYYRDLMATKLTQNQMIAQVLSNHSYLTREMYGELHGLLSLTCNMLGGMKKNHDISNTYVAVDLQDLIKEIEAFKVETCYTPEYHVKNALLAALTGKDHMVVISWLADAYKYALQKEYDRMQNESINQ